MLEWEFQIGGIVQIDTSKSHIYLFSGGHISGLWKRCLDEAKVQSIVDCSLSTFIAITQRAPDHTGHHHVGQNMDMLMQDLVAKASHLPIVRSDGSILTLRALRAGISNESFLTSPTHIESIL